jgi:hypothetical protein
LNSLKQELSKQAIVDVERVVHRRAVYEERKLADENRRKQEQAQMEEKERKIEKFLESVKPDVEADPVRLMSFTKVNDPLRFCYLRIA